MNKAGSVVFMQYGILDEYMAARKMIAPCSAPVLKLLKNMSGNQRSRLREESVMAVQVQNLFVWQCFSQNSCASFP